MRVNADDPKLTTQLAALAEGFCPLCGSRLRPHTAAEADAAATWASPPHAYCATCHGDVGNSGAFVGGWFIGMRKGPDITRMEWHNGRLRVASLPAASEQAGRTRTATTTQ